MVPSTMLLGVKSIGLDLIAVSVAISWYIVVVPLTMFLGVKQCMCDIDTDAFCGLFNGIYHVMCQLVYTANLIPSTLHRVN